MKVKGKHPRGRLRSRWEQVSRDVTWKEDHGKKLLRSCGKAGIDVDLHKVEMSYQDEDCSLFNIIHHLCINQLWKC
jgi:hypothetical protein